VLALYEEVVFAREAQFIRGGLGGNDVLAEVRAAGHLSLDGKAQGAEQVLAEELELFTVSDLLKVDRHRVASYERWWQGQV
jgi:hypothetical protein